MVSPCLSASHLFDPGGGGQWAHATVKCALLLGACAKGADDIKAAYISPVTYNSYTCEQLGEEAQRVMAAANDLAGVQDEKATNDAVATGVALVLFWPAAFMIKGDGATAQQLASLKRSARGRSRSVDCKKCGTEFDAQRKGETIALLNHCSVRLLATMVPLSRRGWHGFGGDTDPGLGT